MSLQNYLPALLGRNYKVNEQPRYERSQSNEQALDPTLICIFQK